MSINVSKRAESEQKVVKRQQEAVVPTLTTQEEKRPTMRNRTLSPKGNRHYSAQQDPLTYPGLYLPDTHIPGFIPPGYLHTRHIHHCTPTVPGIYTNVHLPYPGYTRVYLSYPGIPGCTYHTRVYTSRDILVITGFIPLGIPSYNPGIMLGRELGTMLGRELGTMLGRESSYHAGLGISLPCWARYLPTMLGYTPPGYIHHGTPSRVHLQPPMVLP